MSANPRILQLRKRISKELFLANSRFNPSKKIEKIKLKDLDIFFSFSEGRNKEARQTYLEKLQYESYLAKLTVFWLSFIPLMFAENKQFIPIKVSNRFNVKGMNLRLSSNFTTIANQAYSIIKLNEIGQEWNSRIIFRSILDYCLTFLALLNSPEKMEIYFSAKSIRDEKENWHNHFRVKQLKAILNGLPHKLKEECNVELFVDFFENNYSFYSLSTHPSSIHATLGAYSVEQSGFMDYSIYGHYANASKSSLINLSMLVFLFTDVSKRILENKYCATFLHEYFYCHLFLIIGNIMPELIIPEYINKFKSQTE